MNPARALGLVLVPTAIGALVGASQQISTWLATPIATPLPPAPAAAAPPLALSSVVTDPSGPVSLSARLDRGAVQQGGDGLVHLELTLKGQTPEGQEARRPTDLVVVLDHSGSMAGDKLESARAAVRALVDELAVEDRFALVAYDSHADLRLPLALATPFARVSWQGEVQRITAGSGTNMSAGLDLGLSAVFESVPGRARRAVLISDGLPNEGDPTEEGLLQRARSAAGWGVPMTAVGVGLDFNEDLMRAMADAGTGNYYFLERGQALATVFKDELNAAAATVASSVEVHLWAGQGVSLVSAAGYPVQAGDADSFFRMGDLGGGQERKLWLTLKVEPEALGKVDLGRIQVRYDAGKGLQGTPDIRDLAVQVVPDEATALASIDRAAWEEAVLTEEYSALRSDVATAVKSGKQEEAQQAIWSYRARNEALNRSVGSQVVVGNLNELKQLEQSVTDSFQGYGQAEKQNVFSKSVGARAYRERRKGQMSSSAP